LRTDTRLSEDQREYLLVKATIMYLNEEKRKRVKTDEFEGVIYTEGKYGMIGSFGGLEFRAEIDTDGGKAKLSFLVSERTNRMHRAMGGN